MRPLIEHARTRHTPETLAEQLRGSDGLMLLRSDGEATEHARYSFVVTRPFLTLRTWGSRCELRTEEQSRVQFGNPWNVLEQLLARYEIIDEIDLQGKNYFLLVLTILWCNDNQSGAQRKSLFSFHRDFLT